MLPLVDDWRWISCFLPSSLLWFSNPLGSSGSHEFWKITTKSSITYAAIRFTAAECRPSNHGTCQPQVPLIAFTFALWLFYLCTECLKTWGFNNLWQVMFTFICDERGLYIYLQLKKLSLSAFCEALALWNIKTERYFLHC